MRHHHQFNPENPDGNNQGFERPNHQGFRIHIELGNMGFQQSAHFHHMNMGQIQRHFNPSLPHMEIQGGYEPPGRYAQPNYGSSETNYYQHSRHDQGQLEFTNPYNQHEQQHRHEQHHSHHQHHPHHGHRHGYSQQGDSQGYSAPTQGDTSTAPGRRSIYTYDGATRANPQQALDSARVVAQVARELGVDPVVAVAAMLVESGGNPRAVGDNGHSFGLFQLNTNGELKEARLNPNQAFDPETNARVALSYFRRGHADNPGAMAAAAQRPANRADYARKVNSNMAEAARMVQEMGLA